MVYYALCFISLIVGLYADNCLLLSAFEFKKKTNRLASAGILTGLMFPFMAIKFFLDDWLWVRNICLLCILAVSLLYLHFLMTGRLWQKILFLVLQEAAFFGGEILVVILFNEQIGQSMGITYTTSLDFILCMTINIVDLTIYFFVLQLWKRLVMKHSFNQTGFLVFALFPISQILLTYASSSPVLQGFVINVTYNLVGTIIGFVADGFLIILILRQQHMHEMDQHLKDLQQAWEIEQNHYREIETRREELAKIRHDLKDQFIVMRELTLQKEYDQILTMLNTLSDYVAGTKENVYCADPVVNAIMAENEKKCDANNILLEYDLNIVAPLKLNPVVICNLFSNLFRNAIRAVCSMEDPLADRFIRVKACVKGNYLHVKMENPYSPDTTISLRRKSKETRKHYGLEILQDIAQRQNGQMEITTSDCLYTMQISLENISE